MKILFIGLGSIGQKHADLIHKYFPQHEIFALRSGKSDNNLHFICNLKYWKEVDSINPDIAFICNPTDKHVDFALRCAFRGMHLFIEKPISSDLFHLDRLTEFIEFKKLPSYVAYPFRHHKIVKEIKSKIQGQEVKNAILECKTDLRKWGKEYSQKRETGGGCLLELSHEIDMAQYLFGKIIDIQGYFNSDYKVTKNCEEWANLLCFHEGGTESRIYLDIASEIEVRTIRVETDNYHCFYDFRKDRCNYEQMYLNQLRYFFDNLDNAGMMNNIIEASGLFQKIIEFRDGN